MRSALIGAIALAGAALPGAAMAQGSTTIITQDPPSAPMMRPAPPVAPPGVIVDRVGPTEPSTTGSLAPATPPGCASTVTRQDDGVGGSTTVRQERCNPE